MPCCSVEAGRTQSPTRFPTEGGAPLCPRGEQSLTGNLPGPLPLCYFLFHREEGQLLIWWVRAQRNSLSPRAGPLRWKAWWADLRSVLSLACLGQLWLGPLPWWWDHRPERLPLLGLLEWVSRMVPAQPSWSQGKAGNGKLHFGLGSQKPHTMAIFELPLVEFIFGLLLDSSIFYSSQKPEGRGVTGSLILINTKTRKKRDRRHYFVAGCLSGSTLLVQACKDLETGSWKLECSFSNPILANNPSKNHCFFSKHFKCKTMHRTWTL